MRPGLVTATTLAVVLAMAHAAAAQVDPEPRANFELGVSGPLRGDGGVSGYAFFLWNRPHFLRDDLYLRLVLAPTYLISELVRDGWPAAGHAIGLGVAGGFFRYNVDEFRDGRHEEKESFWGHGAEVSLTYYRRLRIADVLPLEAQIRLQPQYVVYARNDTDPRFRLPADTAIYSGRVGLRLGGIPPELAPDLALELSVWWEPSYRVETEPYGFPERRQPLEHFTQRSWARAGAILTPWPDHTASVFVTAGTAEQSDALSSFRLGSSLPFRSEFPLILHGYYVEEVFARRFWLVNVAYRFPLGPGLERFKLQLSFDYARVDYASGHELPRHGLRGLGAELSIALAKRLTLIMGYGFGLDAPRNGTFGGHEAHAMVEVKF